MDQRHAMTNQCTLPVYFHFLFRSFLIFYYFCFVTHFSTSKWFVFLFRNNVLYRLRCSNMNSIQFFHFTCSVSSLPSAPLAWPLVISPYNRVLLLFAVVCCLYEQLFIYLFQSKMRWWFHTGIQISQRCSATAVDAMTLVVVALVLFFLRHDVVKTV